MTLVELLVTLVVVAVVMALVAGTFTGTLRLFSRGEKRRASQDQARAAAAFVERALRLAGFGIEPALAVDFSVYRGLGASCPTPGSVPPAAACQRDFGDRPDELVFYARDPRYWADTESPAVEGRAWLVPAGTIAPGTLNLVLNGNDLLLAGQVLQVVCPGATQVAYVTVARRVSATAADRGSPQVVSLGAGAAGDPFNQPGVLQGSTCFSDGAARVFAVDRYRFHVQSYPDLDGRLVPYLMLDQGLDRTGAGVADPDNEIPVAEGIEDLQVVYERPSGLPPAGIEQAWVGEAPGSVLTPGAFCPRTSMTTGAQACGAPDPPQGGLVLVNFAAVGADKYAAYSYHRFASASPIRNSPDAANIRAIRLAFTARAVRSDEDDTSKGGSPVAFFNRNASAAGLPALGVPDGFERSSIVSSVSVNNLLSKSASYH